MAKNFDSGLIHAYRKSGNFYKRRCGTTGRKAFITQPEAVTTVSAEWFLRQSDACRKCTSTFDLEDESSDYSQGRSSSIQEASGGSVEVNCPVSGCDYKGTPASVAGHVSGKKDGAHDWSKLGFTGANDYKESINSA